MIVLVCIRSFASRSEAEVARSILRENGVVASVSAPDAAYDVTFALGGAKLFVDNDHAARASELLTSLEAETKFDGWDDDSHDEASSSTTTRARRIAVGAVIVAVIVAFLF